MSLTERLDRYQRKHRWIGFPLAVIYKFFDDQGGYLAALITYYGFLSIIPLLLLATSILGFLLQDNPDLENRILDSALSSFPVIGDQLNGPTGLSGSSTAVIIGIVGALYGALGVAQAAQNAMNVAWAVPRNRRPDPLRSRLRSLLLLATAGIALAATTIFSTLSTRAASFGGALGFLLELAVMALAVILNASVFAFAFRILTAADLSTRDVLTGAVAAAVFWQLMQTVGVAYVNAVASSASATNGVFALVLGLLTWIYVGGIAVVLCVEVNVVRTRHLWPRALLTPFTDDVDLTRADQQAYTDYATAQRSKGFQNVDVDFDHDGQNATAKRARKLP